MTTLDRQQAFTGTKEVASALALDAARLQHYLAANVDGFAGPLTRQAVQGWAVEPDLPVGDAGAPPTCCGASRRASCCHRRMRSTANIRVISALHAQGFPVAAPLLYCADDSVAGTAFHLTRFVDGRVFWEPQMPGSNPAERAAVYDAMNETIARLHSFEPAAIGLGDFGKGENYVARQVERWSKQYRASETQKIDEMERLIEWLPLHIPPAGPVRLVHGDYRLDNLIVARDAPRVIAVLDWELSTLGDPLADFSYHLMAWHMPHSESAAGTATLDGHDLDALGIPSMADYVDDYVLRTGLDPRAHLPAYLAYNFFRIAAILQGIIGRVRDGTATSEHAPAKAELIRPLAEKAWEFAQQA